MDLAFYITRPQVQQLVFRLVLRRWRRFGTTRGGLATLEIGAQGGIEALGLLIPEVFI